MNYCSNCGSKLQEGVRFCSDRGSPINGISVSSSDKDLIHCPKCNSTQLTTNKKGFSGKNAVAGAVLTGGVGLLAGTIGSNNIVITCLSCGEQFKPGEGRKGNNTISNIESRVKEYIRKDEILTAVKYYQDNTNCSLSEAKDYVFSLRPKNVGVDKKDTSSKGGCVSAIVIFIVSSIVLSMLM